jgi:hypothetical protein
MLIQTAYNLLPNKSTCNNGQVLYGAALSSMSMGLSQLSHVKLLGHANYYVMRTSVTTTGGIPNNGRITESVGGITKGYTESHQFYYASTLVSQWLCVLVGYESGASPSNSASNEVDPSIEITLGLLHDSGSGYSQVGLVDNGIRFDSLDGLQTSSVVSDNLADFYVADSGINVPSSAPTNPAVVPPRPLYVPATATISSVSYTVRGEVLSLNVSCSDAKLRSLTIFDIYQSELS